MLFQGLDFPRDHLPSRQGWEVLIDLGDMEFEDLKAREGSVA